MTRRTRAGENVKPREAPGDGKLRRCLGPGCGVMFASHGPGNRLCETCGPRVVARAAGAMLPPVSATSRRNIGRRGES